MARKCRIQPIGAMYHVIQRGNNKNYIFESEEDKGFFMKQVKKYKEGLEYRIYGFVVMDNHYHFIIRTFGQPLHKIMHRWNSNYSKYHNYKYNKTGHVFQARYKSILVQDERYLLSLLKYIHNNPIRAGIVKNINDYKWSSDIYYRTYIQGGIVDIDLILKMFSKSVKDSIILYGEYMSEPSNESQKEYESQRVLGEEIYTIKSETEEKKEKRKSLDELLNEVGLEEENLTLLKKGSKKRELTRYKLQYIKKARELNYTLQEIGEIIGMNRSGVYNLIQRYL